MDLGTFRAFICDDRFDQLAVFQRGDGGQKTPLRRRSFLDPKEDLSVIQGLIHHHLHLTIQESATGFFELRLLHLLQPFTQLHILQLPPPSAPPQLSQSLISSSASAARENLHGFQPRSFTSIIPSNHFSPQSVCSICSTLREKSCDKVSRWDSSCGKGQT